MSLSSFNKIATRPIHANANQLIDRIVATRPDLANERFVVPFSGYTSLTVMTVNEVFKSNMSRGKAEDIVQEYKVLEHLQPYDLGAAIPKLTWQSDDGSIYGMTRIHGALLTKDVLASLPVQEQERIAAIIGRFNAAMSQSMMPQRGQELGFSCTQVADVMTPQRVFDVLEQWYVKPRLTDEAYQAALRLAAYWSQAYERQEHTSRSMFLHPDMHSGNIMYDLATGVVSLIDIGSGHAVVPELAFRVLRHFYPDEFTTAVLQAFNAESGSNLTCAHIDIYNCLDLLCQAGSHPEYFLGQFCDYAQRALQALDELEGKTASAAPCQRAMPASFAVNMR